MPFVQLVPDGTALTNPRWTAVNAGSYQAALSDGSDSTYVEHAASANREDLFRVTMTNPTAIPTDAKIARLNVTARTRYGGFSGVSIGPTFKLEAVSTIGGKTVVSSRKVGLPSTIQWVAADFVKSPVGRGWTISDVNALRVGVAHNNSGITMWQRVYEVVVNVVYATAPTATVTSPSGGVIDVSLPWVTWAHTAGDDGGAQAAAHVKVWTNAVFTGGGFNPETSPTVWDSGVLDGEQETVQVGSPLAHATAYVVGVKTAQLVAGERHWSAWAFGTAFLVALAQPGTPLLSGSVDNPQARFTITVVGTDNILTALDASLDGGVGNWQAETNCTVAAETGTVHSGTGALRMTASSAGTMVARAGGTTNAARYPAEPSVQYTLVGFARMASGSSRTCRLRAVWYDTAGSVVGTSDTSGVTVGTGGWVQLSGTVTAPAGTVAVSFRLVVESAGSGQPALWDTVAMRRGAIASPTWTRGGLLPVTVGTVGTALTDTVYGVPYGRRLVRVEWIEPDGQWVPVRGWAGVLHQGQNQTVTLHDFDAKSGVGRLVRAFVIADLDAAGTVWSEPSALGGGVVSPTSWHLKVLDDPSKNTPVLVVEDVDEREAATVALAVIDAEEPYPVRGPLRRHAGRTVFETVTEAELDALLAALRSKSVLLLQAPESQGRVHRYVLPGAVSIERMSRIGSVWWRRVTVDWLQVWGGEAAG